MTNKVKEIIFAIGMVAMLVCTAIYITGWEYAKHIFIAGSCLSAIARFTSYQPTNDLTLRRLRLQQIFASIAFIVTGIFMYTNNGNEWIACLCIATLLELYTSFRIPYVEKKAQKRNNN